MKSKLLRVLAVWSVLVAGLTALPPALEMLSPRAGLRRSFYTQTAFRGAPMEATASGIGLEFLERQPDLPRQQFSARWRGFFFLPRPQTVEFFAGGNDEVELRVDGELLLRRNLAEGFRTEGRRLPLEAGAHEISVDYQQYGGGMALNIQRTLEGQQPSLFLPTELFTGHVEPRHVRVLAAARWLRGMRPFLWAGLGALFVAGLAALNFKTWRTRFAPRSAREYAGRLRTIAAPALLAPAVVFLMGPHTIFANNAGEFDVPFVRLAAPWLLRTAAINWLLLFGVGCVAAGFSLRITQLYAALLFALGLVFWGQGNLWNADYGVLAGQELDLAEHAWRSPYEIGTVVSVLLMAAVFFRPVSRIAPFASLAFVGVQGAAIAATGAGSEAQRPSWIEPPPEIYQFSAAQNIIHIVLDEFQSDVFADILQQDRRTLDRQFSGFVYFSDHSSAFPTTSMSMPAMLTGQEYRNQVHAPDFVRDAFRTSSIFARASRSGYDIDAISIVPVASFEEWLGPEAAPNWSGARFRIRKPFISQVDYREVSARQLLELSMFRHAPHSAKAFSVERPDTFYRPIWMDREESPAQIRRHEAANSVAFFEQFTSAMNVGRDRPVYKLLHVGVPHRPIVIDRDCRYIGLTEMSRETYTAQSRCAVKLVAAFLDRTRALGIYDSSLIIVSSDHGTDLHPTGFSGKSDSLALVPGPSTSRLPAIAGSAKAIMFIKPPGRTGPISISDAPTTHVDVPPTIVDVLGWADGPDEGSMFRRDPNAPRSRQYGMYDPRQRFPKEYLDRLDVLAIEGRVTDPASWHFQRSIWNPAVRLEDRDVDVGPREAHRYLGPGWSFEQRERTGEGDEVTFARALTRKVAVFASLPAGAVELVLRASSSPGPRPESLHVDVDGRHTGTLPAPDGEGYRDLSLRIPEDPSRPALSQITLDLRGGASEDPVFKLDRMTIRAR